MNAIDISGINQLESINRKLNQNEKLSKAEFIALAAALANDFYDGYQECNAECGIDDDMRAKSLLSAFSNCCEMASEIC